MRTWHEARDALSLIVMNYRSDYFAFIASAVVHYVQHLHNKRKFRCAYHVNSAIGIVGR
jgi:hypothetical protein